MPARDWVAICSVRVRAPPVVDVPGHGPARGLAVHAHRTPRSTGGINPEIRRASERLVLFPTLTPNVRHSQPECPQWCPCPITAKQFAWDRSDISKLASCHELSGVDPTPGHLPEDCEAVPLAASTTSIRTRPAFARLTARHAVHRDLFWLSTITFGLGAAAISCLVYRVRGLRSTASRGPCSTMRPPCMTAIWSQSCSTTARSCEMSR